jgi:hypothetical protein
MTDTEQTEQIGQAGAKAELATQIETLVRETFAQRRQVVLLSYLGQALRKAGFDFREILGEQKLADFIRHQLSDKVRIVTTPAGRLILAAVPADVDLDSEIDPYGASKRAAATGSEEQPDREKREPLVRGIWFAFSHVLESGKARALRLEPEFEYEDYDPAGEKPDGYDVPREMIVPVGSVPRHERNQIIYDNIRAWSAQNGVSFRSLFETQTEKQLRRSALDTLLASLSDSDLSRISMPLDVVAKLRRKQH